MLQHAEMGGEIQAVCASSVISAWLASRNSSVMVTLWESDSSSRPGR